MNRHETHRLGGGFNSGNFGAPSQAKIKVQPMKRLDGEMYPRPEPNPFTDAWCRGYDDGLAGRSGKSGIEGKPTDYWDGYEHGEAERQGLDGMGSSNA